MKLNKLFSLTLTAFALMFVTTSVEAGTGSYGQYGQYGGTTPSQSIIVDKKVGYSTMTKGGTITYVDNYSPSDARLAPGQRVYFQIKVKNTSNARLTNVVVRDIVPAYLEPLEGPGKYDANSRTITYTIPTLDAGKEDVKYFTMQVVSQDKLPADKGLMCITNNAEAKAGNIADNDTAQFCVEKVVTDVKQAPAAGPEFGFALIGLQVAGLGAGVYLRRKTS